MSRLPLELKKDTILEAIFELHFDPSPPNEAVFGIIYPFIIKKFSDMQAFSLPLLQIPDTIRNTDMNLRYQPQNRLQRQGMSINIGPRVINFSVVKPYIGWSKWYPSIISILKDISEANVIKNVERSGLRYLNFIDGDVFSLINANIDIINSQIKRESTSIRTEIHDGEYTKILQLINNAMINENQQSKKGSLIDIDIVRNKKASNYDFKINLDTILHKSHILAKQMFFDILKNDFLNTLEPVYGDNANE